MKAGNCRRLLPAALVVLGGIGMVVGAVDPLEGSVLILPGSGLMALGARLGQSERRVIASRLWAFILVAVGVAALWGLSAVGGFGGASGRSGWWGVLILPYLIGWSLGMWGPGSPRWLALLGLGVGLWYLMLLAMVLQRSARPDGFMLAVPVVLGTFGVLTLGGCLYRLIAIPSIRNGETTGLGVAKKPSHTGGACVQ